MKRKHPLSASKDHILVNINNNKQLELLMQDQYQCLKIDLLTFDECIALAKNRT